MACPILSSLRHTPSPKGAEESILISLPKCQQARRTIRHRRPGNNGGRFNPDVRHLGIAKHFEPRRGEEGRGVGLLDAPPIAKHPSPKPAPRIGAWPLTLSFPLRVFMSPWLP